MTPRQLKEVGATVPPLSIMSSAHSASEGVALVRGWGHKRRLEGEAGDGLSQGGGRPRL